MFHSDDENHTLHQDTTKSTKNENLNMCGITTILRNKIMENKCVIVWFQTKNSQKIIPPCSRKEASREKLRENEARVCDHGFII